MKEKTISRRNFLRGASAVAMASVLPGNAAAASDKTVSTSPEPATRKGPKRGVSFYSYSAEFGFEKNLEDCFEDVHDMGARGIEILANAHIANYPYPTEEWVNNWWALCRKYDIEPVPTSVYGHSHCHASMDECCHRHQMTTFWNWVFQHLRTRHQSCQTTGYY